MNHVSSYGKLTNEELREELVAVTSLLSGEYGTLGVALAQYQREYLADYATSAAGSVSGKNRDAQYVNRLAADEIINQKAKINSLILARDLLVFLTLSKEPSTVPFPNVVRMDDENLPIV